MSAVYSAKPICLPASTWIFGPIVQYPTRTIARISALPISVKPMIAVVDDEESVRNALVRLLRAGGHAVRGFDSGRTFLNSWRFERPDCLLLDIQMPDISGTEVQQALKGAGAEFPIIIVTAHDSPIVRGECMRQGAVAYLCKPPDPTVLLQTVALAIGSSPV
jgi:FixJ family two-component response regulator